jgi:hypothetical protein
MKIAQIAPLIESVPPRLYGGTERIVSDLTEEVVKQGQDVFASGDSLTSARDLSPAANGLCGLAAQFDVLHFHMGLHHFPLFSKSAARDDRQFCGYRPARASARSAHPNIAGAWRLFRIPRANLLREIDYVTAPIALELLRAKVRVFVELYRLRNDFEERVRVRTAWLKVKRGTARSSRMQTISSLNSISISILPRSTDWWLRRSSSTTMKVYCKLSTRRSGRRSSVRILGRRPR